MLTLVTVRFEIGFIFNHRGLFGIHGPHLIRA